MPRCFLRPRLVLFTMAASVVASGVAFGGAALAAPARGAQHAPAQPADAHGPVSLEKVAEEHTAEGQHDAGLWPLVAKLVNFGILVGALVYLLRSPLAMYFRDRSTQIRGDLVNAAQLRQTATEQLATLERRMAALPGELETLKAEGAREAQAEEDRIRRAAASDRERLLEQTRREIELQVRVARRDLMREAAELAVGVARKRFESRVTPEDHARMLDRSTEQIARIGDGPAKAGPHKNDAGPHKADAGRHEQEKHS